jgi:hypothetical protein
MRVRASRVRRARIPRGLHGSRPFSFATGVGLIVACVALAAPAGASGQAESVPRFIAVHARAFAIAPAGEVVLLRARVENSASCGLELVSPDDAGQPSARWRSCTDGRFTERVRFSQLDRSTKFAKLRLLARSATGATATRNLAVNLRARTRRTSDDSSKIPTSLVVSRQQSTVWAGFVSTSNSPTTMVSATWTVPSVACGGSTEWLGTWLGVDGAEATGSGTHVIFQDGVYSYCLDGEQQNEAWWEAYPGQANALGVVGTGDTISASVWKTSNGWMWSVADTSTGASYASTVPVDYSGPSETAEWVVEDPGTPSEPFVEGFTPITFTNMAMTTANGAPFANGTTWQMVQNGEVLATPTQSAVAVAIGHTLTIRSGGRPF